MTQQEAFEILQLSELSTQEEISSAYHRLAMEHHPDKGGDTEIFLRIKTAYELVSEKTRTSSFNTSVTFYRGAYGFICPICRGTGSIALESPRLKFVCASCSGTGIFDDET